MPTKSAARRANKALGSAQGMVAPKVRRAATAPVSPFGMPAPPPLVVMGTMNTTKSKASQKRAEKKMRASSMPGSVLRPTNIGGFGSMMGQTRAMSTAPGSSIFNALPHRGKFAPQGVMAQVPNARFASTQAVPQVPKLKRSQSATNMDSAYQKVGGKSLRRQNSMGNMDSSLQHGLQTMPHPTSTSPFGYPPHATDMAQSRGEDDIQEESDESPRASRRKAAAAAVGGAARGALDSAKHVGKMGMEKAARAAMGSGNFVVDRKAWKKLTDSNAKVRIEFEPSPDGTVRDPIDLHLPTGLISSAREAAGSSVPSLPELTNLMAKVAGVVWEHRDTWGPVALNTVSLVGGPKGIALKLALNMLLK